MRQPQLMVALLLCVTGCHRYAKWTVAVGPAREMTVVGSGRRTCVRVTGEPEGCYQQVSLGAVATDANGEHSAYAAYRGGVWMVVKDGEAQRGWHGVGAPVLARSGDRVAYAAEDADGRWRVVVNDSAGPVFDEVLYGSVQFDRMGRRLAYVATRDSQAFVVIDGKVSRRWRRVQRITFDATGNHVAYAAFDGAVYRVVVDGMELESPADVGDIRELALAEPVAPGELPRVAYIEMGKGFSRLVTRGGDGERIISRGRARSPSFAGRRREPLYVMQDSIEGEALVFGDYVSPWHKGITPSSTPTSEHWGFIAGDGDTSTVGVIDGRIVSDSGVALDLVFGQGEAFAYVHTPDQNISSFGASPMQVVDDRGVSAPVDFIMNQTLHFVDGGTEWACIAGDRKRHELFVLTRAGRVGHTLPWRDFVTWARQGRAEDGLRDWIDRTARRAR
ncbi:MAG TPA: hypothetical protein VKH19_00335 [Gemmatimonadaceae bacterium]|nr:hypothetical protein [Gemmatimonadaceae bacterium]